MRQPVTAEEAVKLCFWLGEKLPAVPPHTKTNLVVRLQPLARAEGCLVATWLHAFELRFLLSDGMNVPPKEREPKKNETIYYLPVPNDFFLCTNLIIGPPRAPLDYPPPPEFAGGQPLWRSRLANERPAVLLGRILPLDDQNREHIRYHREKLKPTATTPTTQRPRYMEVMQILNPSDGNLILNIPIGEEAFRSEQDFVQSGAIERFTYVGPGQRRT
jgi:hypothetical protein